MLSDMGFTHKAIIHKNEFVTHDGVHTNSIENVWSNLKAHLKSVPGSQGTLLEGHIDEYQYRYNRKLLPCLNCIVLYCTRKLCTKIHPLK